MSKVGILFRSPEASIVTGIRQVDAHAIYYMLSLRDEAQLRSGVRFQWQYIDNYKIIEKKVWNNAMNLNYEDKLSWLRSSRDLFRDLFFLNIKHDIELWLFLENRKLMNIISRADSLGIEYREVPSLTPLASWQPPLVVLRIVDPQSMAILFWPDHIYDLQNVLCIGVKRQPTSILQHFIKRDNNSILSGMLSPNNIIDTIILPENIYEDIYYIIKLDMAFLDVVDPIYFIHKNIKYIFENNIFNLENKYKYNIYVRPMLEPLMSNWIGFGEIPMLLDPASSIDQNTTSL